MQEEPDHPSSSPSGDACSIAVVEQAALKVLQEACQRPEAIAAALAVYRKYENKVSSVSDPRRELAVLNQSLAQLKTEEGAAVQVQIAGIVSGLPADAYAEAFAALAARRKDLEEKRASLTASLTSSRAAKGGESKGKEQSAASQVMRQALEDTITALSDESVTEVEKRRLLGMVVERVIAHKEGADIVFAPSLTRQLAGEDDVDSAAARDTFHTTCIGIKTHK